MRLTTLRVLALVTTILVIAAGTCIATFGQTPGLARPLPFCSHPGLTIERGARTVAGDAVREDFRIRNGGAACRLQRDVTIALRDGRGADVPVVPPRPRGYIRMVLVPVVFEPGEEAAFALDWSTRGVACSSVATVSIAIGGDAPVSLPDAFAPCTQADGSNLRSTIVALVSASPAPADVRMRAGGAAANSAPRL